MDNNYFGAAMPPSGTCAHDKARSFAISEITNLCMNFIISSSFLQWPPQNMSNGTKKLKFKISLIFHKKDYSMSNLEQSKVQGNLKRQIQHTLDPGLFSSSLVMMVQPLLWAWKGVRCKKPLDNYIIEKAIFGSKMNSVPKSRTRWNGYYSGSLE